MKALFVIPVYQFSRETWPVIEHFARAGVETHVLVGWQGPLADDYVVRCEAAGATVHFPEQPLMSGDPHKSRAAPDPETRAAPPRRSAFVQLKHAVRSLEAPVVAWRRFAAIKRAARTVVASVRPDVIVGGPYHSCGGIDEGIVWMAKRTGTPYACLPVSPYVGERNAVDARFNNLENGMLSPRLRVRANVVNGLLARLFPSWTRSRDGERIFMFDPVTMLAARACGLLAKNPWQAPSDSYDLVFVESPFSERMLVESGYDAGKVVVCGKPLLDAVFAGVSDPVFVDALYEDLGLPQGSAFVLCNVEPSFEHHYASWEEHWQRFRAVMEGLRDCGLPVVLSLHPLCDAANYRFVEDEYGYVLCESRRIMELYPFASVSVSFPCSTNTLAELFGTPLVIYDFLGLTREGASRSDLFRLPGSICVFGGDELGPAVARALASGRVAPSASGGGSSSCDLILAEVRRRFGLDEIESARHASSRDTAGVA